MRQRVYIPLLEVDEHFVVGLAAGVDLGNHVNAIHCTQIQLLKYAGDSIARYALEHTRDADAGLAWIGFLWLLMWLLLLLVLLLLLWLLSENVRRIGENFRLV